MANNFHEAIYIKSDNREKVAADINGAIWERLVEPQSVIRSKSWLHLSQPVNGWMQLYYRNPDVKAPFVVVADRVIDTAWRAFILTLPEPTVRFFSDDDGGFSFHFAVGALEFASLEKSAHRSAKIINQIKDIDEEWQNHPFTGKVVKLLEKYRLLQQAYIENQSAFALLTWNYKKHGDPPNPIVKIDKDILLKGFGEWEAVNFDEARQIQAQKRNPREKNRKQLDYLGREAEKLVQVPYYWEPEEDEVK